MAQAFLGHGQQVITVRPFNHIGPGQIPQFAVPALAKRIVEADRRGASTIPVGNLSARRDFTDVRDVVRAYRLLIESGGPGEVYNVCSGRDVSIREIADGLLRTGRHHAWSSRPTRRWCGRSRSPCCGATPAGWPRPPGGSRRSRLDQTLADVLAYWREQAG